MPEIDVNGTTLHYEDEGPRDAPVVVLSHSLFFDLRMFEGQTAGLSDRFRVIAYDHRGQGRSARAAHDELDIDTLTEDAAALIEALDVAPCVFLGNSLGGFVAVRLAARRPDLVRSVLVVGSSAAEELKLADFDPLVATFEDGGVGDHIDTVLYIMFGDTTLAAPEQAGLVARWRERILAIGPSIHSPAWHVVHRESVVGELADITVPVTVVAGAEDHAYTVELSQQIADGVPNSRLVVQEGAGHSVSLEAPDAVNAILAEELSRPVGAAA